MMKNLQKLTDAKMLSKKEQQSVKGGYMNVIINCSCGGRGSEQECRRRCEA